MKSRSLVLGLVLGVAAAITAQQRGGPPGVFSSDVPAHELSIVQCDSSSTATSLCLLATKDLSVTLSTPYERKQVELKANVPQTVRVTGLEPGKATPFEASYAGGSLKGILRTPAKAGTEFKFAVQADSHLDQNTSPEVYTRTLQAIAKDKPDFLVDLGDTFMTGKHSRYQDAVAQYRAQHYYFGLVGLTTPAFLVLGNHDGEQGWVERNQTGMAEWSASQRKSHFLPPTTGSWATGNTRTANYYEFTWGDAQVIVLDPYMPTKDKPARSGDNWTWTLGQEQYRWLKKTLEANTPKYRFVFIHNLVGGIGKDARGGSEAASLYEWGDKNGFSTNRPGWELPIHDLLKEHHVGVVFHGHDHFYAKQERDGIVYQLVPQPGHPRGGTLRSAEEYGYLSGKILDGSGYMRVSIGPAKARVEYVKTTGTQSVADSYEIAAIGAKS